jgi:hypothetical protein
MITYFGQFIRLTPLSLLERYGIPSSKVSPKNNKKWAELKRKSVVANSPVHHHSPNPTTYAVTGVMAICTKPASRVAVDGGYAASSHSATICAVGDITLVCNATAQTTLDLVPADSSPGVYSGGTTSISNTTIASDTSPFSSEIGGIFGGPGDLMQNRIVANNSGANCFSGITSKGYNLSSDGSCNFHNSSDRNNTDPQA